MSSTIIKTAIIGLGMTGMSLSTYGQTLIKGEIIDKSTKEIADNVNIQNIYTHEGMSTMEDGKFRIRVKSGELIEISKIGYETLRIRIQDEKTTYYKLEIEKKPRMLRVVDIRGRSLNYTKDSVRFHETYKVILNKERRNEVDMRSMPLAMLSRKQREEWAFQEMYDKWEGEKYIDFTFNKSLVKKITYLRGNDLDVFMKRYRPTIFFLRNATEYEYLEYIKKSYYRFKASSH